MKLITTRLELNEYLNKYPTLKVGLVMTMGNIHDGHLEMIKTTSALCDILVVSIFCNPLSYPNNDLISDVNQLFGTGLDVVFTPSVKELYPNGCKSDHTAVSVPRFSTGQCGSIRPHHTTGIVTTALKMLNVVKPDIAIFGEKDYQQYMAIKEMVFDLCLDVDVLSHPIVRDFDGVAYSSRNRYLTDDDRKQARLLYRILSQTAHMITVNRLRDYEHLVSKALYYLIEQGMKPEYFEICDQHTLLPATSNTKDIIILLSVNVGSVRMLDNVRVSI